MLTSADCACYTDWPEVWNLEELLLLREENEELFQKYPIQIGILKGFDSSTYYQMRDELAPHVQSYLLYLSGHIRSNPKHFSLLDFFNTNFPRGVEKPVYLHGCPLKQVHDIPKLNHISVQGIITAGHITDAIYRGNPHYKRETRIKKAWKKWSMVISEI